MVEHFVDSEDVRGSNPFAPTINIDMITILDQGQNFGWGGLSIANFVSSVEEFSKLPSPKITLLDLADKWYSYDRSNTDLTVYWVTEALANERAEGKPIVKLHPNDRIFSSSFGPNNKFNLLYWFGYMKSVYSTKYKFLIPKNEIYQNNLCCTLGQGRLPRIYTYYKLNEYNLINRNVSFATNDFLRSALPDKNNELPGQDAIHTITKQMNFSSLKRNLELDWRKTKNVSSWWGQHRPGVQTSSIIPTHSYMDSSLLLINETIVYNLEFFVTEKTIKGLLSGRPFIVIGCYKFLEHLKNLGFLTWSSILDETYDEKENIKDRIDSAVASADEYIKSNVLNDPRKLEKIQKITNHNKKVFFETNWNSNINLAITQLLLELGI